MKRLRVSLFAVLAVGLAVSLIMESADDASARHIPPKRRVSDRPNFRQDFFPPKRFFCTHVHQLGSVKVHDYFCGEEGVVGGKVFALSDVLRRGDNPLDDFKDSWKGLAAPKEFRCQGPGDPTATTDNNSCTYRLASRGGCRTSYTFKLSQMASTRVDLEDPPEGELDGRDRYYPRTTKPDRVVCPPAKPRPASPAPTGKAPSSEDDDDDGDEGDD